MKQTEEHLTRINAVLNPLGWEADFGGECECQWASELALRTNKSVIRLWSTPKPGHTTMYIYRLLPNTIRDESFEQTIRTEITEIIDSLKR